MLGTINGLIWNEIFSWVDYINNHHSTNMFPNICLQMICPINDFQTIAIKNLLRVDLWEHFVNLL